MPGQCHFKGMSCWCEAYTHTMLCNAQLQIVFFKKDPMELWATSRLFVTVFWSQIHCAIFIKKNVISHNNPGLDLLHVWRCTFEVQTLLKRHSKMAGVTWPANCKNSPADTLMISCDHWGLQGSLGVKGAPLAGILFWISHFNFLPRAKWSRIRGTVFWKKESSVSEGGHERRTQSRLGFYLIGC